MVIEEIAAGFDDEDLLHPLVRDALDEARQQLDDLVEKVQSRRGAFDLSEPGKEELARLRKMRSTNLLPGWAPTAIAKCGRAGWRVVRQEALAGVKPGSHGRAILWVVGIFRNLYKQLLMDI